MKKVWFITGVSGGFGRALAEEVIKAGDQVAGSLRKPEQLEAFNQLSPGNSLAVKMDVTNAAEVQSGVKQVLDKFGRIDVLVNNAGYGLFGAIEEASMEEVRSQMGTNFMGALQVTQAVLPSMREKHSGHILQISSMAGLRGVAGLGIYNASKFALEGFSEALAQEVAPLGIKVTLIEPGPFRTNWAGDSSVRVAKRIEDYAPTAWKRIDTINGYSGAQPGDPHKAARLMIQVVNSPNPPLHLPLGKTAIDAYKGKISLLQQDLTAWEEIALKTDFEK